MIELLRIRDLALIEDLEMEFSGGMNVLTGETGAGKSFILKALNFLTGEKLGTDLVRPGKEKAVVEGLFVINDEQCVIRRELIAETGRSRFFINDRISSQEVVRDMRASLIMHTSQHGQHKLLQPAFQGKILDEFLNQPHLLQQKDVFLRQLEELSTRREALETKVKSLEEKRDVLEYQQEEIAKVNPKPGEEEELEARRERHRNQSGIVDGVAAALAALHGDGQGQGLYTQLTSFERALDNLVKFVEEFSGITESLLDVQAALHDLEKRLRTLARRGEGDADIEQIESRLYTIAQLKRKLKRPWGAIIALQEEITDNLAFLDSCQLERKKLLHEEQECCNELAATLALLNPARQEAATRLSAALEKELATLGFSEHVRVIFSFTPHVLYPGRDDCTELRARLLWQPNPGQTEQPLDRIASGGELSRFLLALVTLMSKHTEETPTLIFDEVDAGVGGLTLNRVAESLSHLAASRQMLLITHWPHLAKHAKRHFVVQKTVVDGQTYTDCTRLTEDAIPQELLRMSGEG